MPTYKLDYFGIRGRGEVIRLMFHKAGVPFTDNRVAFISWPFMKLQLKYKQLPVLYIDNVQLNQSIIIAHYLAKEFGMAGSNSLEAAQCQAAVENIRERWVKIVEIYMRKAFFNPCMEKRVIADLKEASKDYLQFFEDDLKSRTNGFFVGGKQTYVELELFSFVRTLVVWYGPEIVEEYPTIAKIYNELMNDASLKNYLATCPGSMV